jgi:hypothetical protein
VVEGGTVWKDVFVKRGDLIGEELDEESESP